MNCIPPTLKSPSFNNSPFLKLGCILQLMTHVTLWLAVLSSFVVAHKIMLRLMTSQINSITWMCYFLSHTQLSPCWYTKTDSWTTPRWVLTGEYNERRRARECDGESQTSDYSDEFMGSRLHLSLLFLPICFIVPSKYIFQTSFKLFSPRWDLLCLV